MKTETADEGAFQARPMMSPESIAELRAKLRAAVACNFKCPHGERAGYCDACDEIHAVFADAARSYMQLLLDELDDWRARYPHFGRQMLADAEAMGALGQRVLVLSEALRAARCYVFGDHGAPSLREQIDAALGEP